jgi:hypothetical protein
MSTFVPRNLTARDGALALGVLGLIFACVAGGALMISQFSQRKNVAPTPIPSSTSEPAPTPVLQALEALPTSTNSPSPTVVFDVVLTPTRRSGEACIYSGAWINIGSTPIPDGGFSAYQGYWCDNGYWDIGIADWVDRAGNWGNDGLLERALIKFNRQGVIIDRLFFDLNGNRVPGPTK